MVSSSDGTVSLNKYRIPWHSLTVTCKTSVLELGFFPPMLPHAFVINPFFWNISKVWNSAAFTLDSFPPISQWITLPRALPLPARGPSLWLLVSLCNSTTQVVSWHCYQNSTGTLISRANEILLVSSFPLFLHFLCSSGLIQLSHDFLEWLRMLLGLVHFWIEEL